MANSVSWIAGVGDWSNSSNWSPGVPTASDDAYIGNGGTAIISSGDVSALGESIGNYDSGTVQQTGGTNTTYSFFVGSDIGSSSYNLSGTGALVVNGILYGTNGEYIGGDFNTGTFNQSGGTNTTDLLEIGAWQGATGTYSLTGGTLNVNQIGIGGEQASLAFGNGGVLTVSANAQLNVAGSIQVCANSQFAVTGGTTYAAGLNDYSPYSQTGGTAAYGGMGATQVNLSGGVLTLLPDYAPFQGGASTFDAVSISATAALQVGGELYVSGLDMTGGTLNFGTSTGQIQVQNTANLTGGSIGFFVTGAPASNCFSVLVADSLACSLDLAPSTIGRLTFTPSVVSNSIIINVTGNPASLVWNNNAGGDGQTWDTQGNQNWTSNANIGNPNQFYTLDNALFNDSNNGNYTVNVATSGVQPNSLTVNTASTYTFTGGAIIGGTGGLNVTGGALNLQNANSWYAVSVDGGTLTISGSGSLSVLGNETVGNSSVGVISQASGTNYIQGALTLGASRGALGTYNLSGSGALIVAPSAADASDVEYIGYLGAGNFVQTGGINSNANIDLGEYPGSIGTYTLSAGSLLGAVFVGSQGQGTLYQSGGSVAGHTLFLAQGSASFGSYILSNGVLTEDYEIAAGGTGIFYQTGGTNNVRTLFDWTSSAPDPQTGAISVGMYYLSGTGSLIATEEFLDGKGTTVFNQSGGTNTILLGGELNIGPDFGCSGVYVLSGGTFLINGSAYIGGADNTARGTGTLTLSYSGQLIITGKLQIYPTAQVNINGGSATVGSLSISPGGILNLNDAITINYEGSTDPVSSIRSYLQSGSDNGKWEGSGISSSLAASTPGTAIGYADSGTQIVLQYTWVGDANLDGVVDAADLSAMSPAGSTWQTGDFNYDGKVNGDDYSLYLLGAAESQGMNISYILPEPSVFLASIFYFLTYRGRRQTK